MSLKENTREMCLDIGVGFWGNVLPQIYTIYRYVYMYAYICIFVCMSECMCVNIYSHVCHTISHKYIKLTGVIHQFEVH